MGDDREIVESNQNNQSKMQLYIEWDMKRTGNKIDKKNGKKSQRLL